MSKPKKQNDNLVKIVDLLSADKHVSGNSIAQELGVSRAAVWKAIKKLLSYSVPISTYKDGYKLDCQITLLNHTKILKQIKDGYNVNLELFESIESTNKYLLENSNLDLRKTNICLAEFQSLGKGRIGKNWIAPFGQNICLSVCTLLNTDLSKLGGLSLAISLAIAETLQQVTHNNDIKVKWPNDVMYKKKKISGILIQAISEQNEVCKVVIGVGINVNLDPNSSIFKDVNQKRTSLKEITNQSLNRNDLTVKIINNILEYIKVFTKEGFEYFLKQWQENDLFFNQTAELLHNSQIIKGIGKGVNKNGQLLFEIQGKVKTFSCGETSFAKPI